MNVNPHVTRHVTCMYSLLCKSTTPLLDLTCSEIQNIGKGLFRLVFDFFVENRFPGFLVEIVDFVCEKTFYTPYFSDNGSFQILKLRFSMKNYRKFSRNFIFREVEMRANLDHAISKLT